MSATVHTETVIIGGGISGLGVAQELSRQGRRSVLLEASSIAQGASANSLRIIHGGFRYLQNVNIHRVILSLKDQAYVRAQFPEIVQPLHSLMPLSKFGLKSKIPMLCALTLYRALAAAVLGRSIQGGVLNRGEVERREPLLNGMVPYGAFYWEDLLLIDPEELHRTMSEAEEVRTHCTILSDSPAVSVARTSEGFSVVYTEQGKQKCIAAQFVVNCSSSWSSSVQLQDISVARPQIEWCKAFNLILNRPLTSQYACAAQSREGRLYFVVPRVQNSVLGTEYIRPSSNGDRSVTNEQVQKFIDASNQVFPHAELQMSDVAAVECGLLPCAGYSPDDTPQLFGSFELFTDRGYVEVLSTKYTTFHSQALAVLRALQR